LIFLHHRQASTNANAPQTGDKEQSLRDQETALVKLGELYRDQKCVLIHQFTYFSIRVFNGQGEQKCTRSCGGYHTLSSVHVVYCEGEDCKAQYVAFLHRFVSRITRRQIYLFINSDFDVQSELSWTTSSLYPTANKSKSTY